MTPPAYSNVTLTSLDGDLSVVVFLPASVKSDQVGTEGDPYYFSSRFEHGSMIGSITRKRRYTTKVHHKDGTISEKEHVDTHVLYGTDMWRASPHNNHWPESGVGLASEFGVGDDGALCFFRCGWPEATDVTNGVLGYETASNGESFLKIGVGELLKGTCPSCDSTDDYKFNSPYLFASAPKWSISRLVKTSENLVRAIQLTHQATLEGFGYKIVKDISLSDNVLAVTTTLQNLGVDPFSTAWYSHHLFSCDGKAIGPGYILDLDVHSVDPVYTEPGTWSWATPLQHYGLLESYPSSVHLEMTHDIEPGTRIKAEFTDDHATSGAFTLSACETSIEASLISDMDMYAYNLYMERGTLSPEPQLLIRDLQPGEATKWTLQLLINDNGDFDATPQEGMSWKNLNDAEVLAPVATGTVSFPDLVICAGFVTLGYVLVLSMQRAWKSHARRDYTTISNSS